MRDAFTSFCDALFDEVLREVTLQRLSSTGLIPSANVLPASQEERVHLIEQLPPECVLALIYRFQFLNPRSVYAAVRSYVDNAPRKVQFIHEFIQNAEDAGARRCNFEFYDDHIVIRNDGQVFSAANLYAICSFRESDKANVDRRRLIGKFGIGFKSVFRICHRPLVITWTPEWTKPLAFRFFVPGQCDVQYHEQLDQEAPFSCSPQVPKREQQRLHEEIGYLFPVPTSLSSEELSIYQEESARSKRGSIFILPLRRELLNLQEYERLVQGVRPECFTFLEMQVLEVHDRRSAKQDSRVFEKKLQGELNGSVEVLEISELDTSTDRLISQRVLRHIERDVPVPVQDLQRIDELARTVLPTKVRIGVVVPLERDSFREPTIEPRDREGQLFSGLPVASERPGLNFDIDAPFNLAADRENILDDGFNEWLIEQIAGAVARLLVKLRHERRFWLELYRLIPLPGDFRPGATRKGLEELVKPIHDRLLATAAQYGVLPAHDGCEPLRPEEAIAFTKSDAREDVASALHAPFRKPARGFHQRIGANIPR